MSGARPSAALGAFYGSLVAGPAIVIAILSGGAGHGDYVVARALFPLPMLLTAVEDRIGPMTIAAGLLQFPLYGAILGRRWARRGMAVPVALLAAHGAAVALCLSGRVVSDFS